MKKSKTLLIIIFVLIIFLIIGIIIKKINERGISNIEEEYIPEEEISDSQIRNTIISLYFFEPSSNNLKSEGRLIDSIELLNNPYLTLINLLIFGPKNENLQNVFPNNTQLLNASINGNNVTLNFSSELLNFSDEAQKYNIINSILKTLAELNEVNSFNILINGSNNETFPDTYSIIH